MEDFDLFDYREMTEKIIYERIARDMIMYTITRMLLDSGVTPPTLNDIKEDYDRVDKEFGYVYDEVVGDSISKRNKNKG